eukprot:127437-Prymnesium_polylepis.1
MALHAKRDMGTAYQRATRDSAPWPVAGYTQITLVMIDATQGVLFTRSHRSCSLHRKVETKLTCTQTHRPPCNPPSAGGGGWRE